MANEITNADLIASQNPYTEELAGLSRQQALAQMLLQQGQQTPQGQMISGRYVKPSPLQNINNLLQTAVGTYGLNKAEKERLALAEKIRQGKSAVEEEIINKLSGTPAVQGQQAVIPQGQTLRDDNGMLTYGSQEAVPGKAATGPDYAGALKLIRTNAYGAGKEMVPEILKKQLGPEDTADYRNFLKVKEEFAAKGIPITFNQYQDIEANRRRPVNINNINTGQHGFDNTLKLGENFKSEPIYKTHQEINQAYKQVISSLDKNNAVGDYAAAVKISKLLDPTSVVRESEVATVANATGLVDKLSNYANKIAKGESLNPQQRTEYRQLAKDFYKISGDQYNEVRNKYLQIGQQNKLEGTETILGAPWKAPVTSQVITPTMKSANEILGIPSMNGNQ